MGKQQDSPTAPPRVAGGIAFEAVFVSGNPTVGTLGSCNGTTNSSGLFKCPDRKAPGSWVLEELNGPCFGLFINVFASPGQVAGAICRINLRTLFLQVSPNQIDLLAPPSSLDITSEGMNCVYGMPVVQIVDAGSAYDSLGDLRNKTDYGPEGVVYDRREFIYTADGKTETIFHHK